MKNLFKIAALFSALGLAAAFCGCSNSGDTPVFITAPVDSTAGETSGTNDTGSGGAETPVTTPTPTPTTTPGTTTTYTINFDANDGSQNPAKATQIFTAGVPQKLTPVAELGFKRDNFNFAGWALSSAASQAAYVDGAEYTGNISITLYAVWTKIIYTVTFDYNNGSETQTQSVESGQPAAKPADPAKDHFNFAGWCSDIECQTPFDFATPITGNTTLYAKWSDRPVYIVTFDLNGGEYGSGGVYNQNVEEGSKATRPANAPTKDDKVNNGVATKYTFVNWYADAGCGTLFDFDATTINCPTTVYAKWNETNTYVVTFDLAGGKYGSSDTYTQNVEEGGKASRPANAPTKEDKAGDGVSTKYTFVNWYADAGCGTLFDFDATVITGPVTVYAKWNETKCYVVTFDLGGGKYDSSDTYTQNVKAGYKASRPASAPTKDDAVSSGVTTKYTFVNWYADASCGTLFNFDATSIIGPKTIYAKWTETKYYSITIVNNSEHGSFSSNITEPVVEGTLVTLTASPNPGYKLSSYAITYANSKIKYTMIEKFTMPASPVTVTATFTVVPSIQNPLTLEAIEADAKVTFDNKAAGPVTYRVNGGEVQSIGSGTTKEITLSNVGDKVCFYGDNAAYADSPYNCSKIACDKDCYVYGNIMSLVDSANYENARTLTKEYTFQCLFSNNSHIKNKPGVELALPATKIASYCYSQMFYGCKSLTSAPELPATTLAEGCYNQMFYGCQSLPSAPVLPATTLEYMCYERMFYGCHSLTSAPALPATTLANRCYSGMFYYCTSLAKAPTLPATTLAGGCYKEMFSYCTSLTSAPTLPATTLESNCYDSMFLYCTSLTSAPALPATKIASYCYDKMFYKCTNLAKAPAALPATTLKYMCYTNMFADCKSLASAPALPATTLASYCYAGMFNNCTSLTSAPALPATTLEYRCYANMFNNCTSLTSAPKLPATTLAEECYSGMFFGCTSLASVTCFATDISAYECTLGWLYGVKSTGTFKRPSGVSWPRGENGIPDGWTVVNY